MFYDDTFFAMLVYLHCDQLGFTDSHSHSILEGRRDEALKGVRAAAAVDFWAHQASRRKSSLANFHPT
jgi:hypothetical protein